MRIMTRRAAGLEGPPWEARSAREVAQLFDSLAPQWHTRESHDRTAIVNDALERGLDELRARSTSLAGGTPGAGPDGTLGATPQPASVTGPGMVPDVALELGSGLGTYTGLIGRRFGSTLAADLSMEMQRRAHPSSATRVVADGSTLPLRDRCLGALVLINSLLFPAEVDRLLAPGGVVVWVNSSGESTPIHLSTQEVVSVLPFEVVGVEARAGIGTWCALRRLG